MLSSRQINNLNQSFKMNKNAVSVDKISQGKRRAMHSILLMMINTEGTHFTSTC